MALPARLFAQSTADVNMLTGGLNVNLPIYTVSRGQVAIPVSLSYGTNGIKLKEVEGSAGMGWNVLAGGQISRSVRGLPDDVTKDNSSAARVGWMNIAHYSGISGFSIANTNNNCTDEGTDLSYINTYIAPYSGEDTEPDIFYVNAPGLSCKLVYDRVNTQFRIIDYQDLVLSYTTIGGSSDTASLIKSFVITNSQGIKYTFGAPVMVTEKAVAGSTPAYFGRKYALYQNGITYYNSWNLISIADPNGNGVGLTYASVPVRNGRDSLKLYLSGSATPSPQYTMTTAVTDRRLNTIYPFDVNTSYGGLSFSRGTLSSPGQTGQTVITAITGFGRVFNFGYSEVTYFNSSYARFFLRNFYESGCSTPVNYAFTYRGETKDSYGLYTTYLADSSSKKQDYWGYYTDIPNTKLVPKVYINPSNTAYPRYSVYNTSTGGGSYSYTTTAGVSRVPNSGEGDICAGCLLTVSTALGAKTTITYEQNTYLDVPSGASVTGGGVRVKTLTDNNGVSSASDLVRNYEYVVPGTSNSSGKPLSMPQFAFTLPYNGSYTGQTLWDYITVLSEDDLSEDDHTIMYSYVRTKQAGAGSTLYQYYVPASYWDSNAAPACDSCGTEWYRTVNNVARNSCTSGSWNVRNDIYSYPFIPATNYDFERGMLQKVTNYDEAGNEVSESTYKYKRSYTPSAITAFRYEDASFGSLSMKAYNKYAIYYNTSELSKQVVNKVYDSATLSQAQTSTVNYYYGSANHKLMTQQIATDNNGSTYTTKYTYVKDYASATSSNAYVNALYYLKSLNMNLPVETYQTVTRGSTTLVTGGSLNLFSAFTLGSNTRYMPAKQMKLVQLDGLAASSFTPYAINTSANTSTPDSRYFTTMNFTKYDDLGNLMSADDDNKNVSTTIIDRYSNRPIASFANAKPAEVAFSDFDNLSAYPNAGAFTISGTGSFTAVGSHAGLSYGMPATTRTLTSPALTKSAMTNFAVLSLWINSTTGTNTLNVSLNGGTATGKTYAGAGGWKYYEFKIDVSAMPSAPTTFNVSFTSQQNITVDDVLFYPNVAEANTVTYDATYNYKIAQTNTNGISSYFANDNWGRVLYAYDQDKNIIQKNTYLTQVDAQTYAGSTITTSGDIYSGVPVAFTIVGPDNCAMVGATVDWNFGDGTTTTNTAGLVSPNHTYASTGTRTVSATMHSPLFGDKVLTPISVGVTTAPPPVVALSYATYTFGGGDITIVRFYDATGTTLLYTFTGSQLNSSTVPPGNYLVKVYLTGATAYNSGTGTGYASVNLNGSCWGSCKVYSSTNAYQFNANLSTCTTLAFEVYQYNYCL